MQQMHEPTEGMGALRSRRRPPRRRAVTLPEAWSAEDVEAILATHQEAVAAQIQQGIRALHNTAARLMSRIARGSDGVSPEDAGRGLLAHVDERYQALNLRMERLEGALRQLVQTFKKELAGSGGEGHDLEARLEHVAEAVRESAAQQRGDLQALAVRQQEQLAEFTRRTGEGLAQVAARAGESVARMAERQEEILDRHLDEMRQAIDRLGPRRESPERVEEPSTGPQRAVSVFVERLQAAEGELAKASDRIRTWNPFEDAGPDPA